MILFILFFGISGLLTVIDFCVFVDREKRAFGNGLIIIEMISLIIAPWLFLEIFDEGKENDCCIDNVFFSPSHRVTIYFLILICIVSYFYSSYRKRLAPPLIELILNCFLMLGIVLNVFIMIQSENPTLWFLGNVPIITLLLTITLKNHKLLTNEILIMSDKPAFAGRICLKILTAPFFLKFPLLIVLCLPILLLLSTLLFIFGQRPDSAIRAFTDTYKHGLSQLDHLCDNVHCGGHYLCSVAANGHKKIVKPQRYGERNGGKIICNRQLLISNAFEQLIEERFPQVHLIIRKHYDKVGDIIHKDYRLFHNKYFSDVVYLLMKPLEWIFLAVLYAIERNPEDRIERQYIKKGENFF